MNMNMKNLRKIEKFIQSQEGALDKFIVNNRQNPTSNSTKESTIEHLIFF